MQKVLPKKVQRRQKILAELQLQPQLKVHDLAERLAVSQETIRRDLSSLENMGQLERTFGGAVGLSSTVPGILERQKLMIEERDRISEFAAGLVQPNDIIMVGGGSTTLRFAIKLVALNFPFTVVTHSLPFASSIGKNRQISVELLPGKYNPDEGQTTGINTITAIREFSAHKAFVGASSVTESGVYALLEPGQVYRAIIESSLRSYVLVDSSKFGVTSLARYKAWGEHMMMISDRLPHSDLEKAIRASGADIHVA